MGKRLLQYYEYAKQQGGLQAKMRLAIKTGMPSDAAGTAPDAPEDLAKFHKAATDLFGPGTPQY